MSDDPNFLARWSRRKQEAKLAESPTPADSEADGRRLNDEPAALDFAPDTDAPIATAPAELPAEELAKLPRIEDMTVDTDITQFLRAGVPAPLRNAALRRMWATDPAIRDFVGEALDYAYDWNTPGGVPGSGPLLASDDVAGMLRQIMGERKAPDAELTSGPETAALQEGAEAQTQADLTNPPPGGPSVKSEDAFLDAMDEQAESVSADPPAPSSPEKPEVAEHQLQRGDPEDEAKSRTPPKRHGGAVPS